MLGDRCYRSAWLFLCCLLIIALANVAGYGSDADSAQDCGNVRRDAPSPEQQAKIERIFDQLGFHASHEWLPLDRTTVDYAPRYLAGRLDGDAVPKDFGFLRAEGYGVSTHPDVSDSELTLLLEVTPIVGLNLQGTGVTDKSIAILAGHPCIRAISLYGTNVGDAAMKELARLKTLQRLRINETKVTGDGISMLKDLPRLEMIDAWGSQISDLSLDGGFPALEEIGLTDCPLERISIKHLPKYHGPLNSGPSTGVKLELVDLPMLERVSLVLSERAEDQPALTIRRTPRLADVCLDGAIRDCDLERLEADNLRRLSLGGVIVGPRGLPSLQRFTELRVLVLRAIKGEADASSFAFLDKLRHLKELCLDGVVGPLPQLTKLTQLEELSLYLDRDYEGVFSTVAALKALKRLSVEQKRPLSDSAVTNLLGMQRLDKIIVEAPMTGKQLQALRSGFKTGTVVVVIPRLLSR